MSLSKPLLQLAMQPFIFVVMLVSFSSHAISLDQLIAENKLTIETKIKQSDQQIVGQPIVIAIEIATKRWFAKGTEIKSFELADTIILANSDISINGSKRVNGQTWSTQTREITLYPRRQGNYDLPAIEMQVSVNTENDGVVEGTINTVPQRFTISLPKALSKVENFIVSPQVNLEVLIDSNERNNEGNNESNNENNYLIGSAITQTITVTAQSAPAMMIPPVLRTELTGLSIYQKTPQVFDETNRGELIGTRIETFTYIFEQSGKYEIPEQVIFWWDTSNNELQKIIIPNLLFNVGKGRIDDNTKASAFHIKTTFSLWLILVTIIISLAYVLFRFKNSLTKFYANVTHLEQRSAKKAFLQAVARQQYIYAVNCLYKYSLLIDVNLEQLKSTQMLALNKVAFDNKNQTASFTVQNAKSLLNSLVIDKKTITNQLDMVKTIKLNNQR